MYVGQRSSKGDLSAQPGSFQLEVPEKMGSTTQTIPSTNEDLQLKILMRDELLIHVQKFITQVLNFCIKLDSIIIYIRMRII